jgi:putative GTP pyrophosphokinase
MKENDLIIIENFLENKEQKLNTKDETFEKLMFFYKSALNQLETQMKIVKDEFQIIYQYDLIDHIDTRIKEPKSILKKMEKKKYKKTYSNLIEKINDIAGIRIVCTLKDDIFFIKDLVKQNPYIKVLEEKDYVTNPKKSGYSSYHMIVEVPVKLTQKTIDVKCEIQIRTLAMDFWANFEHKVKYKAEKNVNKKTSKELITCAKMVSKFDNKMVSLKSTKE